MVRAAGLLLLACGPALAGLLAAARLARRPRVLRELAAALEQMEREVAFRLTPLPELFARLAEEHGGPVGAAFSACGRQMEELDSRSVGEIWRRGLESARLDLDGRSARTLEELGDVLGRYDVEGLRAALARAAEELAAAAERAEAEREQKGRMTQVLGLTAGAALFILLW